MTGNDPILPTPPRRIIFIIYPGFEILDLSGPSSAFSAANMVAEKEHYVITVLSGQGGLITASSGLTVQSEAFQDMEPCSRDTLFIVGAEKEALDRAMAQEDLKNWLIDKVGQVDRFGSFCMGSFILAQAGLLDNKRVVTHWAACRELARFYPEVSIIPKAVYVKDSRVWTSAGVTTGIDMALAMIGEDLGKRIMGRVARRMVIYSHRPGDQEQISSVLDAQVTGGDAFPEMIAWLEANLEQSIKVSDMAEQVGMSERSFYRKFTDTYEITPSKYLERLRLHRAKQFLQAGLPLKAVVPSVGFFSEANFRKAYKKHFGSNPSEA